jgi:hypothetical protein
MAIPAFQIVMRPLLELAADGREIKSAEAVEALAKKFDLTAEEREELLPSGRQRRFNNRVAWALAYFRATHLMEATGRGRYVITQRGRDAVASEGDRSPVPGPVPRTPRVPNRDWRVQALGKGTPRGSPVGNAGRGPRVSPSNAANGSWKRIYWRRFGA